MMTGHGPPEGPKWSRYHKEYVRDCIEKEQEEGWPWGVLAVRMAGNKFLEDSPCQVEKLSYGELKVIIEDYMKGLG